MNKRGLSVIAAGVLLAAALAGCGDDGDASAPEGSATPTGPVSQTTVDTLARYTGGEPGAATKDPITIGFINSQGGANAFPQYTVAVEGAVKLVNERLGGIDGHPIKLKTCFIPDKEEQGQVCAQQFLGDKSVVAVMQAATDTGAQSFHATLAGKLPVLGVQPTPAGATAPNTYYISGGQFGAAGFVTYAKDYRKAKSVAMLSAAGLPVAVQAAAAMKKGFEAAGIKVTQATYNPATTDFVPSIVASGAQKADLFLPLVVVQPQCIALAKALKQTKLRAETVTFNDCLGGSVKKALGDFPEWTYLSTTVNEKAPATGEAKADVDAYNDWFRQVASRMDESPAGVSGFQMVLVLSRILTKAGADDLTAATVGKALKEFTGPVFMGEPKIAFGQNPALPAIGSFGSRFYAYKGHGTWTDTAGGQWVRPPAIRP
ncbi:ABC transporter substrate-binding protein [Actinomadura sp. LD22]|uniref:ABC transporter substrate-binding protein n=1 Tax=Actinomadura physcomitrii TaxID=2650748 RepID=A0A6I4MKI8_9ACTN|nr:ABC transporter substrate-binding protein [Actinomadura physcomitrii]MWA05420.1 ABC transporter substrate-binding protein [Actinomadura physcomitrii]